MKTKYKRRTPEEKAAQAQEDRRKLAELGPIDDKVRCSIEHSGLFLQTSVPSVYRLIHDGVLESFVENGRRWVTVRSIKRLALPPDERPKLPKVRKFVPIKSTPTRRVVALAAPEKARA